MEETAESLREQINTLWNEHYHLPFPEDLAFEDVNGINLVLLDSDIAGCVSTYVGRGNLDVGRAAVLGLCYGEVVAARSALTEDANEYFGRLETLAELVLRAVAMKNSHFQ